MPGTLILRPLQANLNRDTELVGKMDPYCLVTMGKQKVKGPVCENGGKHPHWDNTLVVKKNTEPVCIVEVKNKNKLLADDVIGGCEIDTKEIEATGEKFVKWYPLYFKRHNVGKVLIEASYTAENATTSQQQPIGTVIDQGQTHAKNIHEVQSKDVINQGKVDQEYIHQGYTAPSATINQGPTIYGAGVNDPYSQQGIIQGGYIQPQYNQDYSQGGYIQGDYNQGNTQDEEKPYPQKYPVFDKPMQFNLAHPTNPLNNLQSYPNQ